MLGDRSSAPQSSREKSIPDFNGASRDSFSHFDAAHSQIIPSLRRPEPPKLTPACVTTFTLFTRILYALLCSLVVDS
ncbi:unnamed protein product [Protopolystoma xenopodis]|uniref:Uncharacterized protein n=1 Tax=Protopolystoma xenopodis TaxID=117903 RepID=A0A3S5C537_9PLAT|nr:unnamed protein product [Protopolystoma xenopodis]